MRKTTGISPMLLIFLSLCLMTFALLSLSGARADEKLSQKAADRTSEYYAAVSEANKVLALIDEQLAFLLEEAEQEENPQTVFLTSVPSVKERVPGVSWIGKDEDKSSDENGREMQDRTDSDQSFLGYTIPVSEGQVLQAEISVHYPEQEEDTIYKVRAWQIINIEDWSADTSMNLLKRETE